nr:hypothetical protein [Tanacetum cinerariifolium]GEV75620.1 hypothetical protein [Tanacetum cinerariifolium]GEV79901.1 hypothetical protein [Tanacetum cinerariifolium]GEV97159.1 hypothetical protein [Tanacetum cinerariifolium]GEW09233.1 hypothetical protein [Tanacetum cinerariifolium]
MLNDEIPSSSQHDDENIREIHALSSPIPLPAPPPYRPRRETWETTSHRSSSLSVASTESENFTTMSREFNALVLAGTGINGSDTSEVANSTNTNNGSSSSNLERIGEDDIIENNPLAIVPDNNPGGGTNLNPSRGNTTDTSSFQSVKKEEVKTKISAWQNAKIAKINNRFKRDDAIINGWENEQVQKSTSWMKKVERKLEEKRARAMEKMQNDIAKARRKSEERRATAEAKRGTKVARVLEVANLMRAVGRAPAKRSFF